jgi:hypothetical protein
MNTKIICLAITYSLLVACGGGGGSDDSPSQVGSEVQAPTESVGVFLDSPVEGLQYETPTRSGLTNFQGKFTYIEGESVTFYLGGTKLGSAQGAAIITPFSLYDMTAPTRASEISAVLKRADISSYDRAINVATLLQTLDRDANPDNGIDLGSAHTALAKITVNLSVKATEFVNETSLETAKAIVGTSARLKLNQVASHLYESLNLSIKSDLVNKVSESLNARQSITTSLEHDDNDKVINRLVDTDNDGVADSVTSFIYDDAGNLTGTSNSVTNTTEILSYDNNNNLVSHFTDNLRKPDIEQKFTFNDDKTLSSLELDDGVDGSVESTVTYHYDAEGHLSTYEIDQDNDGSADALASYTYDNNEVSSYVEDSDNNGDPNLSISYQYDSEGNRTSQNISASTEGLASNTGTFEYDANGNITRYEQDNDQDGLADYIESSAYNSNNKRISYRKDLDANGVWDSVTQYTYDSTGNRTSMQEDSNGDGTIDKQWSSNYDTKTLDNGWDVIMDNLGTK